MDTYSYKRSIAVNLQILHRNDLPLGGFAGLKEHRLVVDEKVGGNNESWNGLGNFVYLADAHFVPKGETRLHSHKEIDVISIMVEGRVVHEGSLEHGKFLDTNQAQAQRAGGEGFEHNEINPDNEQNRMLQLWVLPETEGEPAAYKFYSLDHGKLTLVYGGTKSQDATLDSHTHIEVGILDQGQKISKAGVFMAYITRGAGELNGEKLMDGDLVRGQNLDFTATTDNVLLVVVSNEEL
ncbi:MAG: pilus assembly protein [Gammaproteobacteria bacterium]|nr:MAG: pilus assembly protein [Gammaproteobacteria bacterium]